MRQEQIIEEYKKLRDKRPLSLEPWKPDFKVKIEGFSPRLEELIKESSLSTLHLPVLLLEEENNPQTIFKKDLSLSTDQNLRRFFLQFTPKCFTEEIAKSYYHFYDLCQETKTTFIVVAGGCTYFYWGVYPLHDIDVVVPSVDDSENLASKIGNEIHYASSSNVGVMNYLNLGDVDVLSDVILYSDREDKRRERLFSFDELAEDAMEVDFFGVKTKMTSPEMTVLMKFYLGRFGIDKWGVIKDDYEDGWGTFIKKDLNIEKLRQRANRMGIEEELELAERVGKEVLELDLS